MKQEKLELIIPKKSTGKRIDIALQELMSDYSRAKLQAWIKSGFVLLDSKKISSKDIVLGGERVSVEVQQDEKYCNSNQKIFHSISFMRMKIYS